MAEASKRTAAAAPAKAEAAADETPAPKAAKPTKAARQSVETSLVFRRRLSQGDHGPAVAEVQRVLAVRKAFEGPQDGRYGTLLARAVRRFQGEAGLKVTGEVDLRTWEAMTS